jgi:hypothetical protein
VLTGDREPRCEKFRSRLGSVRQMQIVPGGGGPVIDELVAEVLRPRAAMSVPDATMI